MKICIIAENTDKLDEGMKNVAHHLMAGLSCKHQVLHFDVTKILSSANWKKLRAFKPEVIQYVPGPSIRSFLITKICGLATGAKTLMMGMHPCIKPSLFSKFLISLSAPDLLLAQSDKTKEFFANMQLNVAYLPLGVDINTFYPSTAKEKIDLRLKYRIKKDAFVILHVGHIKDGRNVRILGNFQKENNQVIIVGSPSTFPQAGLVEELVNCGCVVLVDYICSIRDLYALSDCYIFTTTDINNCIEVPLSVLEAMSCNLPIITGMFGGLYKMFEGVGGVYFYDNYGEIDPIIQSIKKRKQKSSTREAASNYEWKKVINELETIYNNLLVEKNYA